MRIAAEIAWANDTLFVPHTIATGRYPGDDDGFTNDFRLALSVDAFSLSARHRMITERGGLRRTDELEAALHYDLPNVRIGVGATTIGDIGGAQIQNAVHQSPFAHGRTLGRGLQNEYSGALTVTPLLSVRAHQEHAARSWLTLSAAAELQLGALTRGTIETSVRIEAPFIFAPFLTLTARGVCQAATDPRLTIPGGYVSGCHFAPAITTGVRVGPVSAGLDMRWNEGGAGHGIGEATLGFEI